MMKENKFNRRSSKKILALAPLSILLFFLVAIVNGLFPERIHGTDTKKASETAAFFSPDPLPVINQALPGDSIKKKTVVKVIHAESPGDTLVTQTIEVIVSGDTTKTIKVIGPNGKTKMEHSGDLIFISEDDEIKDLTGTNRDSVKVIKYVNINKDIDSQQDIKYDVTIDDKKEVIIIRGSKDATWTTRDEELSRTLVIIDGVKHTKRDALAGINPDDIIEMNVIKDPDSIKKYTDKDIETVIILKTRKGNH